MQELRSFLGLVNYFGKFVPNLASIAGPLNNLLKQGVKFEWSKSCQKAFDTLKERLTTAPVLVHFDPTLPLRLSCDASSYGVGAVLAHIMTDGYLLWKALSMH